MLKTILAGLVVMSSVAYVVGAEDYRQVPSPRTQPEGLRQFEFKWAHALASGDPKKIAGMFLDKGLDMPPNKPPIRGRTAIELDRQALAERGSGAFHLSPLQTISGEGIAVQVGAYRESVKLTDGSSKTDSGKYILILQLDEQKQWKISHAIYNSNLPASEIWR
jgi:ketosteroid isomerase-like protein